MRKSLQLAVALSAVMAAACGDNTAATERGSAPQGRPAPGTPGGAAGTRTLQRQPLAVELVTATRSPLAEHLTIVGNLIGAATVEVVPKVSGRLQSVNVKLGDRVARGSRIAKVEDTEVREQVKQAEASFEVARASIRQREADLKFAEINLERSRQLHERQLLPRQTLDDADARYQAAVAQLDLTRAQFAQARARLDELRITLANTNVVAPVDGFVGRRYLDPGAFASSNAPVMSVVDIRSVRLVANLVEKDLRRVSAGVAALVDVDAYPGETFKGRVARVAPVLDPSTRTAQLEVEIPNPEYRLKPGMYARVRLTIDSRENALVVPRDAVVELDGKRGVFVADGNTARFRAVSIGLQDEKRYEIVHGIEEGTPVVTVGAASLRDGDPIAAAAQRPGTGRPAATSGSPAGARPGSRPQ